METATFHSCKGEACPYIVLTGEHIAKITLGVMIVFAVGYVLYKVS